MKCQALLCLLATQFGFGQQGAKKDALGGDKRPTAGKSIILLIRHAEKPASGTGLTPEGAKHAKAYEDLFAHYRLEGRSLKIDALFAAKDSENSARSRLTLTPLSNALRLPLNTEYDGKKFDQLASRLRSDDYKGRTVIVCWKHGEILALAKALGVNSEKLPAAARWPAAWPDGEFHWLLQIVRDESGAVDPARTLCVREPAMQSSH